MIKPMEVDAMNWTDGFIFNCENCKESGEVSRRASIVELEKEIIDDPFECPNCGKQL